MNSWKFQSIQNDIEEAIDPADLVVESDEIELMASAIFDTDEDMRDEAVALAVKNGDTKAMRNRPIRVRWEKASANVQAPYRRRARAAKAASQIAGMELKLVP